MKNLNAFVEYHFLSLNENLKVDWGKSGLDTKFEIDINGTKVQPYQIMLDVIDVWMSGMKDVAESNITDPKDKAIFNMAFNRIANKIFPSLISFIIPSIGFKGKPVITNKEITPQLFWKEYWPKVWSDLSAPERILLDKYTILNKDTPYDELIEELGNTLSDGQPYSGYKKEISEQMKLFYDMIGNAFSQLFGGQKVTLSNNMITKMTSDLNNAIKGSKLEFMPQKKEEVDGEIDDVSKQVDPDQRKYLDELSKKIEDLQSKIDGGSGGEGSKESPSGKDVQSIRKWAEGLDDVEKQIAIDTIKTTM